MIGCRTVVEVSRDGNLSLRLELVVEPPQPIMLALPRSICTDERTGLVWFGVAPAARKAG